MDESSVFQRRLAAALQTMDPAWRSAFIDYEKLRKQVKKIVFLQQQEAHNTATSHTAASTPASAPSSANSSPALSAVSGPTSSGSVSLGALGLRHQSVQRSNKYHQQFHSSLQLEMQQMNVFFLSRTTACTKLFDELGLDHAAIQHQQVHPIATLTFAKVLLDTFPSNALLVLNPLLVQNAGQTRMEMLEPRQIALFKRLLHLCYEIDQLRKYVLINHAILWKVIKKYDKHAGQETQKAFLHLLSVFDFSGDKCSELVHRAQYVSKRLLQQDVDERKSGTCPICLRAPMVDALSLSCSHAFCFTCLLHQPTFWQCCPICRKEDDWDPHMLSIESVMSDNVTQCISTAREHGSPLHGRAASIASSGASLSPTTVVATALNSNSVNGALQSLPPFLQQALLSAVSSAAVAAVSAIKNGGGLAAAAAAQKGDQNNVIQAAVNAAIQAQMGQLTALASPKAHHSPNGRHGHADTPFTPTSTVSSSASSLLSPTSNTSPVSTDDSHLSPSAFLNKLLHQARQVKNNQGVSCHQCKTTKQTHELHFCTSQALISRKGRRRKCRKKYCESCLSRSYSPAVLNASFKESRQWPCPSCLGLCICAACTRSGGPDDSDDEDIETDGDQVSVMSSDTKRSYSKDGTAGVPGASPTAQRRQLQQQRKRKELEMQSAIAQLTASGMLDQLNTQLRSPQSAMPPQRAPKTEEQLHSEQTAAMLGQQPRLKLSASSPSLSATLAALQHQQQQQQQQQQHQLMHTTHASIASTSASSSSSPSSSTSSAQPSSSSSSPSPPSDTVSTPSQQQSDLPGLEVVSPPSSACSKGSSQSNDNSDESDEQNNTVGSLSKPNPASYHVDPVSQVSEEMERSSKHPKRWQLDSPNAKSHKQQQHGIGRLSIPTSNPTSSTTSMSPLLSPTSAFSPSSSELKLRQIGSSNALSTAANSPVASNSSSPTHAATLMFAKSLQVQSDSSSGSSLASSSPSSPSFSAGNSGATTPTHSHTHHLPSPSSRRTSASGTSVSNALLNAQAALNSRQQALKQQQLAQQQAQQQHAQVVYNKLRQQPSPPSAAAFAAASLHRNASVPTLSSPYLQQQQQQQFNSQSRYSFPPGPNSLPQQHHLHPSASAAPIPPLHAVSPLSSLPSPSVSAVSSPRSHMEQLPARSASFGATDDDGFDPLMTLDGDGAGNSGTGYMNMFPPASPPPAGFPYNQQPAAPSASSPFTHDSDLSLLHLGQQPNVRALNEHDAVLPLSSGSSGSNGGIGGSGSNPFNFGVHHTGSSGGGGDGSGMSDKYGDMSSMFGSDYLDDTLM